MFVHPNVEPELVAQRPFVDVAVDKVGADLRIKVTVRQRDAEGPFVGFPRGRIGILGKMIDPHVISPTPSGGVRK